jgi:hypothetical protein
MATDPLSTWKSTLENLEPTGEVSWALNFSNWIDERVTDKLVVGQKVSESKFKFGKTIFAAQLQILTPTGNAVEGITKFADAWEKALLASTMSVPPGTYFGSSSPTTTWASVESVVIDPASITKGRIILLTLAAAPVAASALDSLFPEKFRNAFLALTVTITGKDSQTPPNGPLPLVLPAATVE